VKYVPLLTLALMIALPAHAQDVPAEVAPPTDAPAPEQIAPVAEPEPEVSEPVAEPEPEVSEPVAEPVVEPVIAPVAEPEPEVSEPEPEVSAPVSDPAGGLGTASPEAQTRNDLQQAEAEATVAVEDTAAAADSAEEEDGHGGGTLSAAERLASVTGGQGVPWTFPINWSNNLSVDSMRPQHRPTYNPFMSMSFSTSPRYILTPVVSIGARMSLEVELTDSNLTPEGRDLEWGDLQLDTTFAPTWRPGGVILAPSLAVRLPTSQLSRGQSRLLGPTARIGAIKVFDVLDGLIVGGAVAYTLWTHHDGQRRLREGTSGADNTGTDVTGQPLAVRNAGSQSACPVGSITPDATNFGTAACTGGNLVRHQPSVAVFVAFVPINHLTISASFAAFWLVNRPNNTTYLPTDQVVTANGQPITVADTSPTHSTTITSFSASVGWDWTSYLTTTIGYSTLSFYPDSDGSFENFIYNENSQFNLGVQFRPAALVTQIRASSSDEAQAAAAMERLAF
jgi:hypothetical protein